VPKPRKKSTTPTRVKTGACHKDINSLLEKLGSYSGVSPFMSALGSEQLLDKDTPQRYFYLIVKGNSDDALDSSDVQSFFRTGINTGSDYVFVFVDIANDDRLLKYVAGKQGGADFYQEIETKAPLFLIAEKPISNVQNLKEPRIHKISNYDHDLRLIYNEMGFDSPTTRVASIRFLKRVNRYLHLKPNLFGLGFNLNDMIADILNRMENRSP
jgi:hypothetical protein